MFILELMEPNIPEVGPIQPEPSRQPQPEQTPSQGTPENQPEKPVESDKERVVRPESVSPAPGPVLPPVSVPAKDDKADKPAPKEDITAPATAEDVDVIEKEWVSKAKEIIAKTKDDPHAQEAEFENLQREYLKKRYGKEIKTD